MLHVLSARENFSPMLSIEPAATVVGAVETGENPVRARSIADVRVDAQLWRMWNSRPRSTGANQTAPLVHTYRHMSPGTPQGIPRAQRAPGPAPHPPDGEGKTTGPVGALERRCARGGHLPRLARARAALVPSVPRLEGTRCARGGAAGSPRPLLGTGPSRALGRGLGRCATAP